MSVKVALEVWTQRPSSLVSRIQQAKKTLKLSVVNNLRMFWFFFQFFWFQNKLPDFELQLLSSSRRSLESLWMSFTSAAITVESFQIPGLCMFAHEKELNSHPQKAKFSRGSIFHFLPPPPASLYIQTPPATLHFIGWMCVCLLVWLFVLRKCHMHTVSSQR